MKKHIIKFAAGKDKSHNFGLGWRGTIEIEDGTVILSGHKLPGWAEYILQGCGFSCSEACCCGCLVAGIFFELLLAFMVSKSSISFPLSLVSEVGGEGKQVSFTAEHPKTQVKHPVCIELSNPDTARKVASLLSQDVPGDIPQG